MTRGTLRCIACGQAGHVSANCPEQPRPGLLARLRAWWAEVQEPFEQPTDWQDSEPPETVWPDSGPDKLTAPKPEQVK